MQNEGPETLGVGARSGLPSVAWSAYAQAVGVVALTTALAWLMFPYFELANLIMVYLLGVVLVAARSGRGPSILASVCSGRCGVRPTPKRRTTSGSIWGSCVTSLRPIRPAPGFY